MKERGFCSKVRLEVEMADRAADVFFAFFRSGVELPDGAIRSLENAKSIGGFNRALANCVSPSLVEQAVS